jgi:histidine triad (HIT) family protein
MAHNCVFCQIVQGQLPASVAYEDDTIIAFMDIMPVKDNNTFTS